MTYYYNEDGNFDKEAGKEYKTEKGAIDRLTKEGKGAVYDEEGQMIMSMVDEREVPEGALETNPDGSVPAYDENGQLAGTVDAGTVEKLTGNTPKPEGEAEPEGAEPEGEAEPEEAEPEGAEPEEAEPEEAEPKGAEPEEEAEPENEPDGDASPYFVRTTCDKLKVRNRPDPNASVIGYIQETEPEKRSYEVTEERDGWGRVSVGGRSGWIMLAFAKRAD